DQDDQAKDDKKDAAAKDEKKTNGDKKDEIKPIRIDFDGIVGRAVQVPVEPGQLFGLKAVEGKLHWIRQEPRGMMPAGDDQGDAQDGDLVTYDLDLEKATTLASGVRGYDVSLDGKVLVY